VVCRISLVVASKIERCVHAIVSSVACAGSYPNTR
jgi:hypothetical protein